MGSQIRKKEEAKPIQRNRHYWQTETYDLHFWKKVGRVIITSAKVVQDSTNIHLNIASAFNETIYGLELYSRLTLPENLDPRIKAKLLSLLNIYLCCFIKSKVLILMHDYECHTGTGDAVHICGKGLRFGIHESPTIQVQ